MAFCVKKTAHFFLSVSKCFQNRTLGCMCTHIIIKHFNQTTQSFKISFRLITGIFWVNASYDGSKVAIVLVSKIHIHGKISRLSLYKTIQ
jgi:hypothetical protein